MLHCGRPPLCPHAEVPPRVCCSAVPPCSTSPARRSNLAGSFSTRFVAHSVAFWSDLSTLFWLRQGPTRVEGTELERAYAVLVSWIADENATEGLVLLVGLGVCCNRGFFMFLCWGDPLLWHQFPERLGGIHVMASGTSPCVWIEAGHSSRLPWFQGCCLVL